MTASLPSLSDIPIPILRRKSLYHRIYNNEGFTERFLCATKRIGYPIEKVVEKLHRPKNWDVGLPALILASDGFAWIWYSLQGLNEWEPSCSVAVHEYGRNLRIKPSDFSFIAISPNSIIENVRLGIDVKCGSSHELVMGAILGAMPI